MVSLRSKIVLSLIFMSFVSIALIALSGRILILQRFDELTRDPVAESFIAEIVAYYGEYGSWQAAIEAEPLYSFVQRLRSTGELPQPAFYTANRSPFVVFRGPNVSRVVAPEISDQILQTEPRPLDDPTTQRQGNGVNGPQPPYMILDQAGQVVLSPFEGDVGLELPGVELDSAIQVMHQDELIGYLYSDLRAALSGQESQYLQAISNSWWIALFVSAALSVPIGILLGRRVAGPIDSLGRAMRAMQPGSLEQQVPVTSNDELGHLTASFNKMSKDLADAYEELEKSRQKMEEMSLQDSLTLLPNRRAFDESASIVIAQAYRHGRTCALAMIDVDGFKEINDTYSHAKGDLVLQLLGRVLKSNLREVDILARYGGEEFMVLFPETDLATAHKLMERLRIFISEYSWPNVDPDLQVTVSAGLVKVDVNDMSAEPLEKAINAADKKLYLAKDNGRNRTES